MSDTVLKFDDLSPKQRALFELLRREKQEKRVAILRRATAGPAPLSFAQQRLWFLDQLAPDANIYILPTAVRLIGALDVLALKVSLDDIVRRHEAVRTTFALVDGQPVQVIVPALPLPITIVDLQTLPEDQREHHTRQLLVQDVQRSFDLTHGPLLRATLLRLGCEEHVALLTMHHIVSDGWSMDVLVRELAALYAGHVSGQPATLPPLPIQYADYAVWQRAWLQGTGDRGQGTGDRGQGKGRQGDRETRRQGDKEHRSSTPNTQHPTPDTQHPAPSTQHPTPNIHPGAPGLLACATGRSAGAGATN